MLQAALRNRSVRVLQTCLRSRALASDASDRSKPHVQEVMEILEQNNVESASASSPSTSSSGSKKSVSSAKAAGGRRNAGKLTADEKAEADDSIDSWRQGGSLQDKLRIRGVTFKGEAVGSGMTAGAVFGDSAHGGNSAAAEAKRRQIDLGPQKAPRVANGNQSEGDEYDGNPAEREVEDYEQLEDTPLTPAHFRESNTHLDPVNNLHHHFGATLPSTGAVEPVSANSENGDRALRLVRAIADPSVTKAQIMAAASQLTRDELRHVVRQYQSMGSAALPTQQAHANSLLSREVEKVNLYDAKNPLPAHSPYHIPYKLKSPRGRAALIRAQTNILQRQFGSDLETKLAERAQAARHAQELKAAESASVLKKNQDEDAVDAGAEDLTTDQRLGQDVRLYRQGKLFSTKAMKEDLLSREEIVLRMYESSEMETSREKRVTEGIQQRQKVQPISMLIGARSQYNEDSVTQHPFEPYLNTMDANEDEDMEYDGLLEVELEDVLHDLYNDSRISPPMPEDLIKAESKQGDQFKQQLIAMKRKLGYQVPEEKASAQEIERLQKLNEWRAKRAEQQQKFYSETDQLQMLSYEALERDPFSPSFSADQVASSETLMTRQMNKSAKERTEQQQTARVHLLAAKRLLRARSGQLAAIQRSQEEAEEKKASERHETPEAAAAAEAAASESEKHRFSEIKALGNDIAGLKALIGNLQSMVSGVEGVDEDDVADGAKSDAESPAAKSADDEGVFQIPEHVLNQQMKEMPTGFQDPAPAEVPWMGTRPQAISVMDYDLSKYQKETVAKFRYLPKTYLMEPGVCQITNGLKFDASGAPILSLEAAHVAKDQTWRAPLLQEARRIVNERPLWPNHVKEKFLHTYARAVYRPL